MLTRLGFVAALLCTSRKFEGDPPPAPSLAQAKELAASANLSVDAQEQRAKDIIAMKDQVITDTNAALDIAKANGVDQELIDAITAIKTNADDNFTEALRKASASSKGSRR